MTPELLATEREAVIECLDNWLSCVDLPLGTMGEDLVLERDNIEEIMAAMVRLRANLIESKKAGGG